MASSNTPMDLPSDLFASVYNTIFARMDQGFSLLEKLDYGPGRRTDFRYLTVNQAFETHTGLTDVTGKTILEVVPGAEQSAIQIYDQVALTGESAQFQRYIAALDIWIEVDVFRVNQKPMQIAVLFSNVTERKKREASRELLISIAQDLGQLTDEAEIIHSVGAKLAAHLGITCYHYVDIDEDGDQVTVLHFWHMLDVPAILGTHPLRAFVSPEALAAWRLGKPTIVDDIEKDIPDGTAEAAVLKAGAAAQKISAFMAVGLSQEGKCKAYFAVADSRPRKWTDIEIELIQEVAGQLLPRIERARAEEAARASLRRVRSIADLVPDLLWDSQPDGSTNWYNQRWLEYTGQTFGEAIGWGWVDAIHPDDREGSARRYGEAVKTGQLLRQEHRIRRYDGQYRWFVVSASPVKDENGHVIKMYGAATDIHDRKESEEALQRSEEKYRRLFESIDDAFCIIEVVYNDKGKPVDFRWLEANPAYAKQTGLSDVAGKLASDVIPGTEVGWYEIWDKVLKTGKL